MSPLQIVRRLLHYWCANTRLNEEASSQTRQDRRNRGSFTFVTHSCLPNSFTSTPHSPDPSTRDTSTDRIYIVVIVRVALTQYHTRQQPHLTPPPCPHSRISMTLSATRRRRRKTMIRRRMAMLERMGRRPTATQTWRMLSLKRSHLTRISSTPAHETSSHGDGYSRTTCVS